MCSLRYKRFVWTGYRRKRSPHKSFHSWPLGGLQEVNTNAQAPLWTKMGAMQRQRKSVHKNKIPCWPEDNPGVHVHGPRIDNPGALWVTKLKYDFAKFATNIHTISANAQLSLKLTRRGWNMNLVACLEYLGRVWATSIQKFIRS